jgi:crotonyl-CoA reductase
MPKPAHLTWEEAAVNALCNSTSYRMLVGKHGARMKQGDVVLIWGATGGIGAYAAQYVLNGGGIPVCVVSRPTRRRSCATWASSTSSTAPPPATSSGRTSAPTTRASGAVSARTSATSCGEDPDIVFEHPGRSTFAASMYVAKRGGTVVTCAATSGFMMEFDNRHFWMRLKNLVGSHFANYKEAWEANRLISKGMIHPVLSQTFDLEHTGEAAFQVHHNMHEGKIGVLCLAPEAGLGVTDQALRDQVGDKLNLFRR